MEEIDYNIKTFTNSKSNCDIRNIKSKNRNIDYVHDNFLFSMTLEFNTCVLAEIQLGLMYDCKVSISAQHRGQQIKKKIVDKHESVNTTLKAIVYRNNDFQNFKDSEISLLHFTFKANENFAKVGINYISLIKQSNQSSLSLSLIKSPSKKTNYDFIDTNKSRVASSPPIKTSEESKTSEKMRQNLFESEFLQSSPATQKTVESGFKPIKETRHKQEPTTNVHSNSYAGIVSDTVIWLICSEELKKTLTEICEVLGIVVLEHPSDIIDFIVCDHQDPGIVSISKECQKKLLSHEWILKCLTTRTKVKFSDFLIT